MASLRLPAVALAILGTALVVVPHGPFSIGARFFVPKAFVLALAALLGVVSAAPAPSPVRLRVLDLVVGAYLVFQLARTLALGPRAPTALPTLAGELSAALLYWLLRGADQTLRDRAIGLMVLGAALVAGLALAEALGLEPWGRMPRRPVSTLGNRNFVAAHVALALPFALQRACSSGRRAASTLAVALLACVIVLCRTRTVWAGCGLAAFVWALGTLVRRRSLDRRMGAAALALAAGAVCALAVDWPGLTWTEPGPMRSTARRLLDVEEGSGAGRLDDMKLALGAAVREPLGVGPRQWADAAARSAHGIPGRHASPFIESPTPQSDLARVLAEAGAVGLGAAAAFVLLVGMALARGHDDPLVLPLAAALCILAVHALFDAPLFRPEGMMAAAVLTALAPASPATRWRLPGKVAIACALLAACLGVAVTGARVAARWLVGPGATDADLARAVSLSADPELTVEAVLRVSDPWVALRVSRASVRSWPHAWGFLVCQARREEEAGFVRSGASLRQRALAVEPHAFDRGAAGIERRCSRRANARSGVTSPPGAVRTFRATDLPTGPQGGETPRRAHGLPERIAAGLPVTPGLHRRALAGIGLDIPRCRRRPRGASGAAE